MRYADFLQNHKCFCKGDERTALERQIIDYEGRVCYDEDCIRRHPDDPCWKMFRDKDYAKLKELQHQWRKEHHLLGETEAVQLTFDF